MINVSDIKPEEILIYLRKSRTDDPALSVSDTLARHEQLLDEWSRQHIGGTVPERNRFREIVSGETIDARPEVQKVLRLIEQPNYKALLIVEPQRLSRGDLEDIGRLSKLLRYTGTAVLTMQYVYDLSDDRDREFFERELKRGNEYLEYSKRIMANGRRASLENGNFIGSLPPYGYAITRYKNGSRYANTLEIVPEEAEIVRQIYRMYADGIGGHKIADTLHRQSAPPPHMSHKWTADAVYHILDNPHYIGKIKYGARKKKIVVRDGEVRATRPRQQPEVFDGKHPAIISEDIWDAVRRIRSTRQFPRVRSSFDLQNPLAGLLVCGVCGSAMVQNQVRPGKRWTHCVQQTRCENAGCYLDIIVRHVADAIRAEIADRVIPLTDASGEDMQLAAGRLQSLQDTLQKLQKKKDALWEKYAEGMPRDTFERLLAKNQDDIDAATADLADATRNAQSIAIMRDAQTSLHAALDALEMENAPVEELNTLLKCIIKKIVYTRKKGDGIRSRNKNEPDIYIEFLV